ncbi:E3 SUMO-protein ligase ZBED1-like [Misgurnus anguillicaudatus]
MQPLSVVEDKGFRAFVNTLDPKYRIPCRQTTKQLILERYSKEKQALKDQLTAVQSVCLTTDLWTSVAMESYISVTAHYISDDFSLQSKLLEVEGFEGRHTADAIATHLRSIILEWGLQDKVFCVTTDNGANVVAAVKKLNMRHLPCFAHTLNLIVKDSLAAVTELDDLRSKVRRVVGFFRSSCTAKEKLDNLQKDLKMPQLRLLQEVETRWNSTYLMLERFFNLREPLSAAMSNMDLPMFFPQDWAAMADAIEVLRPFLEVTEEMSAESNVTSSKLIVLVRNLQKLTRNMANSYAPESVGHRLAGSLNKHLTKRCGDYESTRFLAVSMLLDPRFKKVAFGIDANAENAIRALTSEASQHNAESQPEATTSQHIQQTGASCVWSDFDSKVKQQINTNVDTITEVKLYLSQPNISRMSSALDFWKEQGQKFPNLQTLTKKYLAIMATSVPSERVFSKSGELISKRRSCLKSSQVKRMMFLHYNM